jgi:hypothetical protein
MKISQTLVSVITHHNRNLNSSSTYVRFHYLPNTPYNPIYVCQRLDIYAAALPSRATKLGEFATLVDCLFWAVFLNYRSRSH